MPELPEVETVRLGLLPAMLGKTIAKVSLARADLRRPFPRGFAKRLTGHRVAGIDRRAKYIVVALDSGDSVILHLGMSGSFRIEAMAGSGTPGEFHHPRSSAEKHDHVVFTLSDGTRVIYNDPRRFGLMDVVATAAANAEGPLAGLGLEPLHGDLTASRLAALLRGRRTSIKAALLDQRIIAGLGNIYVCEALWDAAISPFRTADDVAGAGSKPSAAVTRLAKAIPKVLRAALDAGGSSLRNYARTDGSLGMFQHRFRAYDRKGERCSRPGCGGTIARVVQNGRSTFYCPRHQR
ncbi:MAG: bifunctional DNA-formamidopyrimidine glycosylase/DNA-(apurinic or apyrimidinic site) lyase [Bauldia sp.]